MFANPNGPSVALAALAVRRLPLVLLLREPIQRAFSAFSAYLMTMANLAKKGQEGSMFRFDRRVRMEVRGLRRPRPARFNQYSSPTEYVRLGLYGSMLDKIMGAGYVVLRGDRDDYAPANSEGQPRMVVMVSERFKANRTLGLVRLWRFLGVPFYPTVSRFSRPGSYTSNLTDWARRQLWDAYRSSTLRTYEVLGERVDEWEAYYAAHNLGALPHVH